ncbi:MAG: HYR domain-containing protein, partial [Bacteroidetes bacterium]|nr:HYR domain-containing protein [Bacteroidota bacterium]
MYNSNASPTVVNCKFIYNNASNSGGGAYFNNSNITIENCSFNLNSSGGGGGVNILSSSIAFNACQFTGNRAKTEDGGGIYATGSTSLTMSSCQVTENSAISFGGGILSSGLLTILSSQINNNSAANVGGVFQANRELVMTNCEIKNNTASFLGAGIDLQDTPNATLTNCVISGNSSQSSQGGVTILSFFSSSSQATLINCTVANNTSVNGYKAIWVARGASDKTASVTLKNTIVANNPGGNFLRGNQPTNPVYFGTIQSQGNNLDSDGSSGLTNGTNGDLVNVVPKFVSSTDLHLQACSPAIDAGTNQGAPTTDFEGNARVDAIAGVGVVDMGAYEYQSTYDVCTACLSLTGGIVYVNASAAGSNNGSSWANAFTDLQSALSLARANPSCVSQIWVAQGTYRPTSGTDRTISFSMVNGVAIYGGFPNTGNPTMTDRNWATNVTILSGDIDQNDATAGNANNSYHVISNGNATDATAILDGFTITAGRADVALSKSGGGVFNDGQNGYCNPTFRYCIFRNNEAGFGGAVSNDGNNGACNPTFTQCSFWQNKAIHNSNISHGGAVEATSNVSITFTHCTFAQNTALADGGALMLRNNFGRPQISLRGCIFWGNSASGRGSQIYNYVSTISLQNNLLQGGLVGIANYGNGEINNDLGGNLSTDPLFVDAANGNLQLQVCSPAINAGNNSLLPNGLNEDLAKQPRRFNNGTVDMGAYEYQGTFDAVAPVAQVTNSVCTTFGSTPSGGVISAPSSSCPAGSTLYYSTDNGGSWSTTLPTYAQAGPAQTIVTRCTCDANPATFGPTSTVTTVPGTCPACPDLTVAAPAVQVTNSVCTTFGGTASGGVISAPSSSCPAGSTLQYSTDNGGNWSETLPTYEQTGSGQTILTRCNCTADASKSSPTSTVTTVSGTCPACPDLTATAPVVQVTNSVCTTFGSTPSGGVISAPSSSCPAGSTLQYSTDNGGNWSETLPTYAQTGTGQTILTRCNCTADASKSSPTSTVTTVPGVCPACPDLTVAAPAVQVTNSVCTTFGGTPLGGVISAPSSSCPAGSTLQYSTNNGGNWSIILPTYEQTGSGQTILTRCNCTADASKSSPTSTMTTVPGTCPACPDLTVAAPAVQVTNSVCTTFGGTASGGVISAPSSSCPAGSTLQYSTDNGSNWSETLPTYAQTGSGQTILTRCNCSADASKSSPTSTVTTVPGTCPACPDLTLAAPAVQVTNSVCTTFGGTASGGVISAPSSSCPAGSTLQYSTNNGGNWSITLPTYEQTGPAQTILTRCNCTADASKSSPTSTMTTVPGTCPACPDLTSAAPAVQVTNSVCTTFGGTASGGLISAPSSSCPVGSTLYYSTDNGGNWSKTLPTYVQEGPAQTILTRCTCDANANTSSPTSTVTTVPGVCPGCPVLTSAAPAVQVTNSVCQTGCVIGGGSIAVPSTSCPVGSTLQYQLNGGDWSTTLPTYVQTGPAQTIKTRCVCNSNASQTSPESSVTTVPGTVPSLVVPANGSAVVSCAALATLPVLPVVNDCSGAPISPSSPVITNSPDPLTCEGTRTYTYTYVCGTRTASWSFVYTIEREGFTISVPNGSATVYDPSLAVAPTPPTVLSQCGETLPPSAPVITNSPNPLLCEGTRTYTYTYTDCEGNTANWSYVYTILDNIAPTIVCPANITACEGQTITFAPPVGTDNCLGAVTTQIAGLPTSSLYPVGITTNTYKVTATNGQSSTCLFTVTVQGKPTITLSTLQQTLNEGNNPVLCDTDANPVNSLQFNVSGLCVVGSPVWRVQVGSGAWSTWSATAPVSQPSNNQPHRYQAA